MNTTPRRPLLDMTPTSYDVANRRPCYSFPHSLPNVSMTTVARQTPDEAYNDAAEWCEGFRDADRMGNFAHPLGVAQHRAGFVGVYEYYHSNS